MRALRRLRNLWRGDRLDREFDEEIAFHFDERIRVNLQRGMSRTEAQDEARVHFGSVARAREGMREARSAEWIPAFGRDAHVACRALRRQPLMAGLAILTLALGIGANAAVFALIDGMLLRPLPYRDSARLVSVLDTFAHGPARTNPTIPELLALRESAIGFDALSFVDWRDFQIGGGAEPARVVGARSETSLLPMLGVAPALGRLFVAADSAPGASPVVVLTDGFWRSNFGSDQKVIGRRIVLNGISTEVVGVLPGGFQFDFFNPDPVGVYVPFPMIPVYTSWDAEFAGVRRVMTVGRLKPGVSVAHASGEVQSIGNRIARAHQAQYRQGSDRRDMGLTMRVEDLQESLFGGSRRTAGLIAAAVLLLLMLACVNMTQFLLARAFDRHAELGVRSALGAARARLARQLVAESTVLAGVAAVTGLLVGGALIALLRVQVATQDAFVASRMELSAPVITFTLGLAGVVALACNLMPVMRLARSSPLQVLTTREVAPRTRTRHLLIAVQVAATVTLLGVAGLLVHSIRRLDAGDRGYRPEDVVVLRLRAAAQAGRPGPPQLYQHYLERIRTVPGVASVAIADGALPLYPATTVTVDDRPTDAATLSAQQSGYSIVSPDYFTTLGIPLRAGRFFSDADDTRVSPVAIVNEALARQFWPGQSALGHRVKAGNGPRSALATVVGVVGDVRPALQLEPMPQVYVSYLQQTEPNMMFLVRAPAGSGVPIQAVKQAVWAVAPEQPLFDIRPLSVMLSRMTAEPRRSLAVLLGTVGLMAVIVSGAGVFTLVTYVTARRRREIALRRVIGAGLTDVLVMLSAPTLRWTCVGLAGGVAGSMILGDILRSTFAGVAPDSLSLLAGVSALYLAVAAAAMCAPALSALRNDPAVILRSE